MGASAILVDQFELTDLLVNAGNGGLIEDFSLM
jgi:hypothetical protein